MKKSWILVPILILILSFTSNRSQMVASANFDKMLSVILTHDVPEISVGDFSLTDEVIVLDSREKKEFDVSHLPGALWVGFKDFDIERLSQVKKSQKIVVYCSMGYRSEKIVGKLIELGYTDVANLYGGIFEWVNQDGAIHNASGNTTKIHGYNRMWSICVNKGEKIY